MTENWKRSSPCGGKRHRRGGMNSTVSSYSAFKPSVTASYPAVSIRGMIVEERSTLVCCPARRPDSVTTTCIFSSFVASHVHRERLTRSHLYRHVYLTVVSVDHVGLGSMGVGWRRRAMGQRPRGQRVRWLVPPKSARQSTEGHPVRSLHGETLTVSARRVAAEGGANRIQDRRRPRPGGHHLAIMALAELARTGGVHGCRALLQRLPPSQLTGDER